MYFSLIMPLSWAGVSLRLLVARVPVRNGIIDSDRIPGGKNIGFSERTTRTIDSDVGHGGPKVSFDSDVRVRNDLDGKGVGLWTRSMAKFFRRRTNKIIFFKRKCSDISEHAFYELLN